MNEEKETPMKETAMEDTMGQPENAATEETCVLEEAIQEEVNEVEALRQHVKELTQQLETAKNDYFKAFADADNRKKRLQQEFDTNMKYRIQSFALEILPALDNFERALSVEVTEGSVQSYVKGYQMIYDQIMGALKNEGLEAIEAKQQPFDPNFHHGIMVEKVEGVEPGIVLQELQKGYKLKDRVIRASMVKVSE